MGRVTLTGRWTLAAITPRIAELRQQLTAIGGDAEWDCRGVGALDSAGMIILWRAWDSACRKSWRRAPSIGAPSSASS